MRGFWFLLFLDFMYPFQGTSIGRVARVDPTGSVAQRVVVVDFFPEGMESGKGVGGELAL